MDNFDILYILGNLAILGNLDNLGNLDILDILGNLAILRNLDILGNENSGDYVEVDFEWKQELGEDFCGLISQGSLKFEWPGAKFPSTPSYCFGCAGEDFKVSRLRGRKPGFSCEDTLRDITSSTGSRIRLLGGGIDYGVPEGCYANHHQVANYGVHHRRGGMQRCCPV